MLLNARSLLPKIDELRLIADIRFPTIICLTETWLNDSVESSLICIRGYQVSRADRCFRRGGGAAVYVRDDVYYDNISEKFEVKGGIDFLVMDISTYNVFLICIYIPPSLPANELHEIHDFLVEAADNLLTSKPNYNIVIAGDMNKFNTDSLCKELALTDIITKPTRLANVLDHVLVTKSLATFYDSDQVVYDAPIGTSDHLVITCVPDSTSPPKPDVRWHKVFDFRKSFLQRFLYVASLVDWNEVVSDEDIDAMWSNFHSVLMKLMNEYIPTRLIPITSEDKEWMTPITKMLILDRWEAYNAGNWIRYNHLKEKVKKEILRSKEIWAERMTKTPNGLWRLVKCHKPENKGDLSALADSFGSAELLVKAIQDKIATHFSNSDSLLFTETDIKDDNWCISISEFEVRRKLRRYPVKKASGLDGIPTRIYVELADIIAQPLTVMFNQSCKQRKFPESWKAGVMVPVPKTKKPEIDKLRFLTLLPLPGKILESLVLNKHRQRFEESFGLEQHGFRTNASTTTALLHVINSATKMYEIQSNFGVAVLNYDLSCAFDCVNHSLLITKLLEMEYPTGLLKWLISYLKGRQSVVRIQGCLSSKIKIEKGVPQGSVLGPPLFCAFVSNFLAASPEAEVVKYADDLTVIVPLPVNSANDIQHIIDSETDNVTTWCEDNRLVLNRQKSKCLLITKHVPPPLPDSNVEISHTVRFLGVQLDNKLSWDTHIQYLKKVGSQRLHILRKMRGLVSHSDLHRVYTAIIRSILEYACPAFVGLNKKQARILQRIDKRAHRIMNFGNPSASLCCDQESLAVRRLEASVKLWRNIESCTDHTLHTLIPHKLQRSKKYSVQFYKTNKYGNSYFPFMTRFLNELS